MDDYMTDDRCSSSASFSSTPVVPPIVVNEKDRKFLADLNEWIYTELTKVDQNDPEQRYTVHREAFDMVIGYVTAYKPLLNTIKVEYESCINIVRNGQREALFLGGKLNEMANGPTTMVNYKRQMDDLISKMQVIDDDNVRLQQQLDELRSARLKQDEQTKPEISKSLSTEVEAKHKGPVPGLSIEQATDISFLSLKLEKLERQYRELSLSHHNRYSTKETKEKLKDELTAKVTVKEEQQEEVKLLKQRQLQFSVAVQAAQAYLKIQPPFQMIGEAVLAALARHQESVGLDTDDTIQDESQSRTTDDDDPLREKEAEQMLAYIEKFNELMDEERFEEAAVHAANGQKGILRTHETLQRFKDVSQTVIKAEDCSPLLAYCESIMSTVPAFSLKPDEYMSYEFVCCALNSNRLDLLSHWIHQDRLTLSERIANEIYNHYTRRPETGHSCLSMAQNIYLEVGQHVSAAVCMVQQGRHLQAVLHVQKNNCTIPDITKVISRCPDPVPFVVLLCTESSSRSGSTRQFALGVFISTLRSTDSLQTALDLLTSLSVLQDPSGLDNDDYTSLLTELVSCDNVTTQDEWTRIAQCCRDEGYVECALELMSAFTVSTAIKKSHDNISRIEGVSETCCN